MYEARRHLAGLVMDGWDVPGAAAAYEDLLIPMARQDGPVSCAPPVSRRGDSRALSGRGRGPDAGQRLRAGPDAADIRRRSAVRRSFLVMWPGTDDGETGPGATCLPVLRGLS